MSAVDAFGAEPSKEVHVEMVEDDDEEVCKGTERGCDRTLHHARQLADKFGALLGEFHTFPDAPSHTSQQQPEGQHGRQAWQLGGSKCFMAVLQDLMARSVPTQRGKPTMTTRRTYSHERGNNIGTSAVGYI